MGIVADRGTGAQPPEPTTPWIELVPGENHGQPHFLDATYNDDNYLVFYPMPPCTFYLAYRPSTDTVWESRGHSPRQWVELNDVHDYVYILRIMGPNKWAVRQVSLAWAEYNDGVPDAGEIVAKCF